MAAGMEAWVAATTRGLSPTGARDLILCGFRQPDLYHKLVGFDCGPEEILLTLQVCANHPILFGALPLFSLLCTSDKAQTCIRRVRFVILVIRKLQNYSIAMTNKRGVNAKAPRAV